MVAGGLYWGAHRPASAGARLPAVPRTLPWTHDAAVVAAAAALTACGLAAANAASRTRFEKRVLRRARELRLQPADNASAVVRLGDAAEPVEWVNMSVRKMWRVYLANLERWLQRVLQRPIDRLADIGKPALLNRVRIEEFTLDHESPVFRNMSRRTSRKDSDLSAVFDVRYTGGARMLLALEFGGPEPDAGAGADARPASSQPPSDEESTQRVLRHVFSFLASVASAVTGGRGDAEDSKAGAREGSPARVLRVPVIVRDFDLEGKLWVKVRLAPLAPYVGSISLAFVGQPTVRVQLSPYNRVPLMRIPILKKFLTKLLTVDLPGAMMLPRRLNFNINPSFTAIAEAAIGQDTVRGAVLAAIAAEQNGAGAPAPPAPSSAANGAAAAAITNAPALPEGLLPNRNLPPMLAGGITLPDTFQAELVVNLVGARGLPTSDISSLSDPYACLSLGSQHETSKRNSATGGAGFSANSPTWNQEFQFLVRDPAKERLTVYCLDTRLGNVPVAYGGVRLPLADLEEGRTTVVWLSLEPDEAGAAMWAPPREDAARLGEDAAAPRRVSSPRALAAAEYPPSESAGKGSWGEVLLEVTLKSFVDDDLLDSGYVEYARTSARERREEQLLLREDGAVAPEANGAPAEPAPPRHGDAPEVAAAHAASHEAANANAAPSSSHSEPIGVAVSSMDEDDGQIEITGALSAARATSAAAARATRRALRSATRVFRRGDEEVAKDKADDAAAATREAPEARDRRERAVASEGELSSREVALRVSTFVLCAGMAVVVSFVVSRWGEVDVPPPPL